LTANIFGNDKDSDKI